MPYWFDGNNLIGQSAAAARRHPEIRKTFLGLLSHHATTRGGRFLVFFDGDDAEHLLPPRGLKIRYSAPWSTDDAILHAATGSRTPSEIIVVTNDRGLAARCRDAGLKTMDWRRFTATMSRSQRTSGTAAGEVRVNLDEWSRYFGLDPEELE